LIATDGDANGSAELLVVGPKTESGIENPLHGFEAFASSADEDSSRLFPDVDFQNQGLGLVDGVDPEVAVFASFGRIIFLKAEGPENVPKDVQGDLLLLGLSWFLRSITFHHTSSSLAFLYAGKSNK
jgi:hypothetical protein